MPSLTGWRGVTIVAPSPQANNQGELIGGFQNALERGETLNHARQSFLNAGYSPQEVQNAFSQMVRINPVAAANPNRPVNQLVAKPQAAAAPQKSHKVLYTVVISICVLVILATIGLGLFWGTLFG